MHRDASSQSACLEGVERVEATEVDGVSSSSRSCGQEFTSIELHAGEHSTIISRPNGQSVPLSIIARCCPDYSIGTRLMFPGTYRISQITAKSRPSWTDMTAGKSPGLVLTSNEWRDETGLDDGHSLNSLLSREDHTSLDYAHPFDPVLHMHLQDCDSLQLPLIQCLNIRTKWMQLKPNLTSPRLFTSTPGIQY